MWRMMEKMTYEKQGLVIVHEKNTRQCAEYLQGLIGELSRIGCPITATVVESKKFASFPDMDSEQKILYIGDFPESNIVKNNIHKWKYCDEMLGVCYGWHGSKGVISFAYGNRDKYDKIKVMAHLIASVPPGKGTREFIVLHFVLNCLADFMGIKDDNCVIFNFASGFIRDIYNKPGSIHAWGDPLHNFKVVAKTNNK